MSCHDALAGRVALITGGARGIGAAIADGLHRTGAAVAVLDQDTSRVSSEHLAVRADVANTAEIADATGRVMNELGPVDVLVSNAGVLHRGPLVETSDEAWARTIEVNLSGTFRVIRAVLPGMLERRWGRIISLASITPLRGEAMTTAYAASKGGVIGLTKALAREVAHRGVTVNALAPGFVYTEQTRELFEGPTGDYVRGLVPMGRLGEPDDVAGTAVHLALPASGYITGQVLVVDGGAV